MPRSASGTPNIQPIRRAVPGWGYLGLAGFVSAWYLLFTRRLRPEDTRAWLAYRAGLIVAAATFIGATEGLSKVLAVAGMVQIRVWNRISVIIAFCSFLLVALALERMRTRLPGWLGEGRAVAIALIIAALAVVDLGIGWPGARVAPNYAVADAAYASDRAWVEGIEAVMPTNSAIFQFPVRPFPEVPPTYDLQDYDLLRPYLHSKGLRWSYGGVKGRPESDWQQRVTDTDLPRTLAGLAGMGFTGVTVDRAGYADRGVALERELTAVTGSAPITSSDGRMWFYDLRPFITRTGLSAGERRALAMAEFGIAPPRH